MRRKRFIPVVASNRLSKSWRTRMTIGAQTSGGHTKDCGRPAADVADYDRDPTLEHPRCVFQVLKRHFARYTPEMVEQYCGVPKERFLEIAEAYCSASGPEKTGAICYAVGWTQHSVGAQYIRTASIIQLLLGNIGRPGGGILAMRGHASRTAMADALSGTSCGAPFFARAAGNRHRRPSRSISAPAR